MKVDRNSRLAPVCDCDLTSYSGPTCSEGWCFYVSSTSLHHDIVSPNESLDGFLDRQHSVQLWVSRRSDEVQVRQNG